MVSLLLAEPTMLIVPTQTLAASLQAWFAVPPPPVKDCIAFSVLSGLISIFTTNDFSPSRTELSIDAFDGP